MNWSLGPRGVEDNWYEGKPFTGTSFRLDENGVKVAETSFDDGMVDGVEREFYGTGELKSEATFRLAHLHGPTRFYDLQGQIIK